MNQVNKKIIQVEKFENLVAELAIEKRYQFVICGHTHQPSKKTISTTRGTVQYLNSGDWMEHLTALEYKNGDWHIYQYDETVLKAHNVKEIRSETAVVTDEINLFVHSLNA
jgi:UDP-2,3-diacylglucosamine pyrophosphatase LpxH